MNKTIKGCMGCLGLFIASIVILFVGTYIYYEWIWEEWPVERIERITGLKVPKFDIIERHEGERHFTGDHLDTIRIEFESIPSDELFEKIDSMIASGKTGWHKDGNRYSFSVIWGNGFPTPEGENEQDDGTFSITLTRGEKVGSIRSGAW